MDFLFNIKGNRIYIISVFIFLTISTTYAMSQQEKNNGLICAAESLDFRRIIYYLCEGADKSTKNKDNVSVGDILSSKEKDILVINRIYTNEYPNLLIQFPDKVIEYFNYIDTFSPHVSEIPQEYIQYPLGTIGKIHYYHDTVLHRAIKGGEKYDNLVRHLVEKKRWFGLTTEGIDIQNDEGDTPLHLVMKTTRSYTSKRKLCLLLVSRGANASIVNKEGNSPMSLDIAFWAKLLSRIPQKPSSCIWNMIEAVICY